MTLEAVGSPNEHTSTYRFASAPEGADLELWAFYDAVRKLELAMYERTAPAPTLSHWLAGDVGHRCGALSTIPLTRAAGVFEPGLLIARQRLRPTGPSIRMAVQLAPIREEADRPPDESSPSVSARGYACRYLRRTSMPSVVLMDL